MTAPIPPIDRERLAKLLGVLGSEHDGEVVAAGRAADRLVRQSGMTWRSVLIGAPPLCAPVEFNLSSEIDFCLRWRRRLTAWEREFLASLRAQRTPLSTRQRNVLNRIADKLRARAEAA